LNALTREEFDAQASQFIGEVLRGVQYCELNDGAPGWNWDPRFDCDGSVFAAADNLTVFDEASARRFGVGSH
jgi:hypothetical protein